MLIMCLSLSCVPALAAPNRDLRAMETEADEGMQALIEVGVSAFLGPDWPGMLEADAAYPEKGAALNAADGPGNGALSLRAIAYAMALAAQTTEISPAQAASMVPQVFTGWEWTPEGTQNAEMLRITESAVELLPEQMENGWRLGAHIYDIARGEETVTVKADLYGCPADWRGDVLELPEEGVIWLMNGEFSLRPAPDTIFGYTINGWALSPLYQDGRTAAWQEIENAEYEYSLNLPASLVRTEEAEKPPVTMAWQNADGTVKAAVRAEKNSAAYAEILESFTSAHPGWRIEAEPDYDCLYGFGEGQFEMWVTSEAIDLAYCVTLSFPSERQAEYEFYAELIRNSFIAWGISNG